jgi:hypothetical protein
VRLAGFAGREVRSRAKNQGRGRRQRTGRENQVPEGPERGSIGGVGGGFVPGIRLAGEFYAEVVRPLLEAEFPGLAYAAALIGAGSEVLGFDTERSTDHDWLRQGRYVGIWYLIEICRSWGPVIPRPNVGVSSG